MLYNHMFYIIAIMIYIIIVFNTFQEYLVFELSITVFVQDFK
jgi:hypothetical protein